uniref:Uncharacterized protein n=1 Tax=Octopus bimaculoides TaxID=37653 RepID=A0A0L8IH62_OCTBM
MYIRKNKKPCIYGFNVFFHKRCIVLFPHFSSFHRANYSNMFDCLFFKGRAFLIINYYCLCINKYIPFQQLCLV